MIIVAHRIRVGQGFQIGRVAALNVVEPIAVEPSPVDSGVNGDGGALPLEPAPIETSTQGKRSARQPEGLVDDAALTVIGLASTPQSSCCHIWKKRCTGLAS